MCRYSFCDAFRYRRCLIPADKIVITRLRDSGLTTPTSLSRKGPSLLAVAGIWNSRPNENTALLEAFAPIVCRPDQTLRESFEVLPVLIADCDRSRWLTSEPLNKVLKLLKPVSLSDIAGQEYVERLALR